MATAEVQQYVNQRVTPLEMSMQEMKTQMANLEAQILSRDAEVNNAEKRIEEVAAKLKDVEKTLEERLADEGKSGGDGRRRGVLSNPALKNLQSYNGEHARFARWRSKLKGILSDEDPVFGRVMKAMESAHQSEIMSKSDGMEEYQKQMQKIAEKVDVDVSTLSKISQQLFSLMIAYCDDLALEIVESVEEHGELKGLESYRRLYAEQKGTLNQRAESLRTLVLYPDRVKAMQDVIKDGSFGYMANFHGAPLTICNPDQIGRTHPWCCPHGGVDFLTWHRLILVNLEKVYTTADMLKWSISNYSFAGFGTKLDSQWFWKSRLTLLGLDKKLNNSNFV